MTNSRALTLALILLFGSPLAFADEMGSGTPTTGNNMTTTTTSTDGSATTQDEVGLGEWWTTMFFGSDQ